MARMRKLAKQKFARLLREQRLGPSSCTQRVGRTDFRPAKRRVPFAAASAFQRTPSNAASRAKPKLACDQQSRAPAGRGLLDRARR
jgi:hypothetical protein